VTPAAIAQTLFPPTEPVSAMEKTCLFNDPRLTLVYEF
jgi:hypothetical protein